MGSARVCMSTSAAPVRAASSASAGSRSPLTSLSITAPASRAARATSGFHVSTETPTPSAARRSTSGTTRAASSSALGGGRVGDARLGADVDEVGPLGDELEPALDLALERVQAHGVGERVVARVDDPHDQRAPGLHVDGAVAQAQGAHSV